MPLPSSVTRISESPPAAVTTSISRGAGVERVLDQLLDHARRPLDHLAGGDAVDGLGAELADGHAGLPADISIAREQADPAVIPGLVPGIQPSRGTIVCRSMDPVTPAITGWLSPEWPGNLRPLWAGASLFL